MGVKPRPVLVAASEKNERVLVRIQTQSGKCLAANRKYNWPMAIFISRNNDSISHMNPCTFCAPRFVCFDGNVFCSIERMDKSLSECRRHHRLLRPRTRPLQSIIFNFFFRFDYSNSFTNHNAKAPMSRTDCEPFFFSFSRLRALRALWLLDCAISTRSSICTLLRGAFRNGSTSFVC